MIWLLATAMFVIGFALGWFGHLVLFMYIATLRDADLEETTT